MHTLERTAIIDAPREEVFRFFEDPRNLERITPKWMGMTITRIDDLPVRANFRIEYMIRWMGVRIPWVTLITDYDAPHLFADIQAKGPYKYWRHDHRFEELGNQTLMVDTVRYDLPLGPLGDIAHTLMVQRQLKRIFDYRARRIRKLFARRDADVSETAAA